MENGAILSFKTNIGGVRGDGDDSAIELNAQKIFEMLLNLNEVVLIFFKKSIVNGISEVSAATIGERDKIYKRLDVFLMIGTGDERDEIAEKVGDGDDLVTFVGTDDACFATGVHTGRDAREIFVTGKKKSLGDDRGACTTANGDNLCHFLDISRFGTLIWGGRDLDCG